MSPKNRHKLTIFLHILTAFILLLKGYDKLEHHHTTGGYVLIGLGLLILLLTLAGAKAGLSHKGVTLATYSIESAALLVVFFLYLKDGKQLLPYVYLVASIMYLVAFILSVRKKSDH